MRNQLIFNLKAMSKFHETQKNLRKAATKSIKEKRAEKREKKAKKEDYNAIRKIIEKSTK